MDRSYRDPDWWKPNYDSGWERFKAAFRRDWEQTKADLTGGRAGRDLNQDVGDTIAQTRGRQPIPMADQPNMDDAHDRAEARKEAADAAERAARKRERARELEADATEARAEGRDNKADRKERRAESKREDAAEADMNQARWQQAERAARFGYGARQHYQSQEWDDAFEPRLRSEWETFYPDHAWGDARPFVYSGWNYRM